MKLKDAADKIFQSPSGKIVLFQRPNVPIIGWALFLLLSKIGHNADFTTCARALSTTSLLVWATLEITTGVTYARRLLGIVVFVATVSHYT